MKTRFKLGLVGLAIGLTISWLMPTAMSYSPGNLGGNIIPPQGKGNFCQKITSQKFDQQAAGRITKLQNNYQNRLANVEKKRSAQDSKLESKRNQGENNRDRQFTGLREKAVTDAQKAAVEKFIATVQAAVKIRQAAFDTALKDFQTAVDKAMEARRASITTVVNAYYQATKAALDQAKASCIAGQDDATVRAKFVADLRAAKTKLETARSGLTKLGETISGLAATRKEAVKKAITDFRTAMEVARTELQAAFPPTT